jgi:hypothetical protein
MTVQQRGLVAFYAAIAIAALFATWSQNLAYFGGEGAATSALLTFLQETKVNPASRSIAVDIAFFLLAAAAFMIVEARRLGVRFVWLYILFGFLVAISVTFPLFMIARELRVNASTSGAWSLKAADVAGLVVITALVAFLSWFVLS